MKIAIVQGILPHYREDFFIGLSNTFDIDIYLYEKDNKQASKNMKLSSLKVKELKSKNILNKFIYFQYLGLLKDYKTIVLPGNMKLLSVWILLVMGKLLNKNIILWGHGISVKNYLKEEKKLNPIRVFFHKLAAHSWLYTEKEKQIWENYIDSSKLTALNNTINTEKIINLPKLNKEELKNKYKINTKLNFIYCARFTANRRIDLMIELIEKVKEKDIGFIIIGEGDFKPNFSKYKKVYDFGAIYDDLKKHELFTIADLYFQPAWTGLSIVEAMAYSKPIITFKRTENILQCVEYSFIKNNTNGIVAKNINDLYHIVTSLTESDIEKLSDSTYKYAKYNLTIENMIKNSHKGIKFD